MKLWHTWVQTTRPHGAAVLMMNTRAVARFLPWVISLLAVLLTGSPSGLCAQSPAALLRKAQLIRMQDLDSSTWYAARAYDLALSAGADSIMHEALYIKGWNAQTQGRNEEAIDLFHELRKAPGLPKDSDLFIRTAGRIGTSFADISKYDSALVYHLEFDTLIDKYWSPYSTDAKLELGELFLAMGRPEQSNKYMLEAIRRARQGGHRLARITTLYFFLDNNLRNPGSDSLGILLEEYLALTENFSTGNTAGHVHAGMMLTDVEPDERIEILRSAAQAELAKKRLKAFLFLNSQLVNTYIQTGDYQPALQYAKTGLEQAQLSVHGSYIMEYHMLLSELYELINQPELALQHLTAHYTVKDSLQMVSITKNFDELNLKYETARKETQIADQALEIQRKTNQRNLLLGGLAMVVWLGTFVALYLWNRNRLTRRIAAQEAEMSRQQIAQLEQEKQLLAMHSMIEGQEAERMRIARDLHDGLGGLLSTVKAHFSVIQGAIDQLESMNVYSDVDRLIDTASAEVRRISHNMAPHALRFGGLQDAVKDLTNQLRGHGLQVKLEWPDDIDLGQNTEIMLYRIIQELANNVIKYANANQLLIQMTVVGEEVSLIVEDDGVGFDPSDPAIHSGFGLKSVASRVSYLNGTMDIDSIPQVGTTIAIQLPYSFQPN